MAKVTKKTPKPVDLHVGARLRFRRMQLGMTQEKLAKSVDLTFQQIQKYEKGANRIGSSRLQQFADIMKTPVAWFFDGASGTDRSGYKNGEASYAKFVTEQHGAKLLEFWAMLPNQQRLAFIDLVKSMVK